MRRWQPRLPAEPSPLQQGLLQWKRCTLIRTARPVHTPWAPESPQHDQSASDAWHHPRLPPPPRPWYLLLRQPLLPRVAPPTPPMPSPPAQWPRQWMRRIPSTQTMRARADPATRQALLLPTGLTVGRQHECAVAHAETPLDHRLAAATCLQHQLCSQYRPRSQHRQRSQHQPCSQYLMSYQKGHRERHQCRHAVHAALLQDRRAD